MTGVSIASGLKVETWRGRAEFKEYARAWANQIGVKPARIQLQAMKTKWASCSTSGAISFSADLLVERRAFGEAVIVHELLHLKVRNHGPVFRSLVRAFLPGHDDLSAVTCERSRPRRGRIGAAAT